MDNRTPASRSALMSRISGQNTAPELLVRRLLHSLRYRFRLHRRGLPGTPDIVFPSRKKAIFVHGCFWHAHGCRIGQPPKARLEFWEPKLSATKARDRRNKRELSAIGWEVLVVWQCELRHSERLETRLRSFLGKPGTISIDKHQHSR